MSGTSFSNDCPVCGNDMDVYSDYKPYEFAQCTCLNRGFNTVTRVERLSLEEINASRVEQDMEEVTAEEYNKYKEEDFNI